MITAFFFYFCLHMISMAIFLIRHPYTSYFLPFTYTYPLRALPYTHIKFPFTFLHALEFLHTFPKIVDHILEFMVHKVFIQNLIC